MEEIKKKQGISVSEVKEILGKVDPEQMDQIQRWTYDYVSKFSKVDPKDAKKMKQELVKECDLTEEEAVEIINIMPTTLAELRSFTFGWKKLILAETLEKMLKIIKEYSQ
ncbi:MAG: RNA polymerase Rpb4 [Nitrosopumilaceae archaeon]|nr:RNA polymerase Rpb4 [Nitrosopumilaceae archaeon]NIT99450.1 RNA polymerase Rpb4 [Nitrosopumilaceae archaeon]NIU85809.1 RNA polymerase Rpb4 [Nitrosopumilaceae archaeon]NIV64666.1 RNA polymerase Rpb4 [Nitrosopumilaceae archaeon]NIX60053.1 RNA polymerase Rpb4 [Nitrosopumilaceae archaeon]